MALLRDSIYQVRWKAPFADSGLIFLRTNIADGLPPTAESLLDCDERDRENMVPFLPADLQFLHKTYIITLRAVVALSKSNLQSIHCDVRVLRSLIGIFDQQMLSHAQSSTGEIGKCQHTLSLSSRLTCQTYCNSTALVYTYWPFTSLQTQRLQNQMPKVYHASTRIASTSSKRQLH
jgi:hypothetical protein